MNKKTWLGLVVLVSLPTVALSAIGEVKRIFPDADGSISFQLKADSCNAAYNYYRFDGTTPQGKNWYSLILAAASTGTPVAVRFVGDDVPCNPNVDKLITYVYVDY